MKSIDPRFPFFLASLMIIPPITLAFGVLFLDTDQFYVRLFLAFSLLFCLPQIAVLILLSPLVLVSVLGIRIMVVWLEPLFGLPVINIAVTGIVILVLLGYSFAGSYGLGYLIHRVQLKHETNKKIRQEKKWLNDSETEWPENLQ